MINLSVLDSLPDTKQFYLEDLPLEASQPKIEEAKKYNKPFQNRLEQVLVKINPRISNEETMMQSDDEDDIAAEDSICINVPKQAPTRQKPVTNFASARA